MQLPRLVACALLVLGGGRVAAGQGIVKRVPAFSELHATVPGGAGEAIVVSGVPGERSVIRLDPRPPHLATAWQLTLMQAGVPTQTWIGGKDQTLRADEVTFGDDGAVVVIVRAVGVDGGKFVLRASSRLPAGFRHPHVLHPASADGQFEVQTALRDALDLRVRLHFPVGGLAGGQDPACTAGFEVTPPPLAGASQFHSFPVPDLSWPKTCLHEWPASTFGQVTWSADAICGLSNATARIRRHHVVLGKPPKQPYLGPGSPVPWMVQADSIEVQPGKTIAVSGALKQGGCDAPTSRTLRVWLTSPHAPASAAAAGLDLTGPVALLCTEPVMPFALDVTIPPDLPPGLYGLQLLIGTEGDHDLCGDAPLPPPAALPLRVLSP